MKIDLKKILAYALLPIFAATTASAEKLVLAGSDIFKPYIEKTLTSLAKKDGIDLSYHMTGSYSAWDKLKSGEADIAIVAVPKGTAIPEGVIALPLAYQIAVVIVNAINPMEDISTKQLTSIYSKTAPVHAETWAQLGVNNISLKNIMAITTGFSDNIVVELFKYSALGGNNLGPWVNIENNKNVIYGMIKSNNSAIAIVGKLTDNNLIKVLAVSDSSVKSEESYAFRPDKDSIFNGDYPMTLPFYVVINKDKIVKVKKLARLLFGHEIAQKIDATDFYSAPENSRKKSIFELDISK